MADSIQRTLALIKPDAVGKRVIGKIIGRIEDAGLRIVAIKSFRWTRAQAAGFYAVHKDKPFFGSLQDYITSGPVIGMVLEGEDAIKRWRDLMGPTDSTKAPKGTIRGDFGTDIESNATHGSDAPETAAFELGYVFGGMDLAGM
jgi:nucleoside-diphosphate kinase